MQPAALKALEFDRVVEMVRGFALTPMGNERLGRTAPSSDPQKVAQLLAATTETTRYLAANSLFPLRAIRSLPQILSALAIEGRALEAARLLDLTTCLDSIDEAKSARRRSPGASLPHEAATGGAASVR